MWSVIWLTRGLNFYAGVRGQYWYGRGGWAADHLVGQWAVSGDSKGDHWEPMAVKSVVSGPASAALCDVYGGGWRCRYDSTGTICTSSPAYIYPVFRLGEASLLVSCWSGNTSGPGSRINSLG